MDLISKEDAVALIKAEMEKIRTHSLVDGTARLNLRLAKNIIEDMPTIDIVRCKECIWRDTDNQGEDYCMYVKGLCDINESSFCSWGQRKEDE